MPTLPGELFSLLENKTLQARDAAEKAARNITAYFKVESGTWWGDKDNPQRNLWLRLRARARQLGYSIDEENEKDPVKRGLSLLVEEIAYEQWHRMLFARFLTENNLLMHPSGVAVSLQECEELAPEEGEDDAWCLAARYASDMLPGIFKLEDPCAQVRLIPNDQHTLEIILLEIPALVFTCDDSLGWMYQFWQSKKKDEVNASERKIGGADLAPVTQLFTENYMVRFLLENSLGAWWAARHPNSTLVKEWEYLRFQDDGTPAAGTFAGWPERAANVTVMDPCCGSGHFLVAAFNMLYKMRIEEEGLDVGEATTRTLQDNIFGLEIDQRCTQIAHFSLSLIGWKIGGYQKISDLNIACTGIAVKGQLDSWLELAGDDSRIKAGLERLYNLFKDAPDLGSLINPANLPLADRMFVADYDQVAPVFEKALASEYITKETGIKLTGYSPTGLIKAARFLRGKFTLIATNVPYLARGKQSYLLRNFIQDYYPNSKADLATAFIERCLDFCDPDCTISLVTPQNRIM
ncbi:Eco57I restriction-modification methylase domain-containing protein [Chloroflexota bacterium]